MNKLLKTLTVGLLFLSQNLSAQELTHEGTDFWVAYPEVYDAASATFEINISSRYSTDGVVEIMGFWSIPYTVDPGVVTTVAVPGIDAHNAIEETVINRAIHVTAGLPVSVYASTQYLYRSEATVCLPSSSLGSDYMVTTYENNFKSSTVWESEFVVVCGPDPVDVEIIPSCLTSEGSPAGVALDGGSTHLEPGEFYLVQAASTDGLDISGSTVKAVDGTDKFAVYNGHRWQFQWTDACTSLSADPLLEIAYPTPSWGHEFIAVLTEDQDDNVFRVTSLEDDCDIYVDGALVANIDAAESYLQEFEEECIFIETSKQASISQNMETSSCAPLNVGDPAMVLLNSNEQMYVDTATFLTPDDGYTSNYVTIVTRTTDIGTVLLDDATIGSWVPVPFDSEYSYAIEPVAVGSHTVETDGCGFLAYAYGLKYAESYFYAAGVRVNAIDDSLAFTSLSSTASGLCDVDTILFTPFTSGGVVESYQWDFGDGDTSTEENPTHHYTSAGTYTVELIVEYQCFTDTITDEIEIYTSPSHTGTTTDVTCYGDDDGAVDITVSGGTPGYSYDWTPGGATSEDVSDLEPGDYTVVVTDDNGCTSEETYTITEPDEVTTVVDPAGPFEPIDPPYDMTQTGTPGGTWSADCGGCIDPLTGEFDPSVAGNGTWTICYTVGAAPCDETDCIEVIVSDSCAHITFWSDPTCFGFNDGSVTINVSGGSGDVTYIITNESGDEVNVGNSNTANSLTEGWYYFQVDDDICSFTDSVFIDDPDEMEIDLSITDPLCHGDSTGYVQVDTVLNPTGEYDQISYFWSPNFMGEEGLGVDTLTNSPAGDYTLSITDENGCAQSIDFEITQPTELVFSEIGYDPAYCRLFDYQSGNGVVYAAATGGTPDYDYEWENIYTLETTNNTTWGGLNPGTYEITVVDDNGCILTQKIVLDSLSPIADFTVTSPEFFASLEGTAVVNAHFVNESQNYSNPNNPSGEPTFFWNFDHPDAEWILSHDIDETFDTSYAVSGEYEVCLIAQNKNGCEDTACKVIIVHDKPVLVTPNVFTPGKDGINSTFFFPNVAMEEFSATVVNRWGEVMTTFDSIDDSWDGTNKGGRECPDGVYFYKYEGVATNGTTFEGQGTVHLLRDQ